MCVCVCARAGVFVCVCVCRHQSQEHGWCVGLTPLSGQVTPPRQLLHVTPFSAPYPSGGSHYPSLLLLMLLWPDVVLPQLHEQSNP